MEVNENERLSNSALKHKIIVKKRCFERRSTFHGHNSVFNTALDAVHLKWV